MLVLIDNYDSFTYNVAQLLAQLGANVEVLRNDQVTVAELEQLDIAGLVVSPGPGGPASAGVSCDAIERFAPRLPVLGICLGMQCIGHVFGATVARAGEIVHGMASPIEHTGVGVFEGVPAPFFAGRYHSLALVESTLPAELEVTARTTPTAQLPSGVIMGVRHRTLPVEGVQFHPESILTEHGAEVLGNFVRRVNQYQDGAAA